jgi:hypothetical protein
MPNSNIDIYLIFSLAIVLLFIIGDNIIEIQNKNSSKKN